MQTFIAHLDPTRPVDPATDWHACANQLDPVRARKQAVEAQQMVGALIAGTARYPGHHAVTLSWAGHIPALAWHGLVHAKVHGVGKSADYLTRHADRDAPLPAWFGMPDVLGAIVANQRGRLLAKDPALYGPLAATGGPWAGVVPCDTNLYATELLSPFQPGVRVAFALRGATEHGRVVALKPAALEARIQHDRGACWRRTTDISIAAVAA